MNLTQAIVWTLLDAAGCIALWGILRLAIHFTNKKNLRRNVKHGGGGSRE